MNIHAIDRLDLLRKQIYIDPSIDQSGKITNSLERIVYFLYEYTNIKFIDFVDEYILYQYIKQNKVNNFDETIKDVKNLLFYLKYIKKSPYIPKIDLSTHNFALWKEL